MKRAVTTKPIKIPKKYIRDGMISIPLKEKELLKELLGSVTFEVKLKARDMALGLFLMFLMYATVAFMTVVIS